MRTREVKEIQELGRKAFAAGRKRIPAWDVELMALCKGETFQTIDRFMSAWLYGWDQANLAAPVPAAL